MCFYSWTTTMTTNADKPYSGKGERRLGANAQGSGQGYAVESQPPQLHRAATGEELFLRGRLPCGASQLSNEHGERCIDGGIIETLALCYARLSRTAQRPRVHWKALA